MGADVSRGCRADHDRSADGNAEAERVREACGGCEALGRARRERKADGETVFEVRVADGDMGKVIGRQGRIVKQIRILMRAVAQKKGKKVSVEIMD